MGESYKPRVLGLLLLAAFLTIGVTILRVIGEQNGWDPTWFRSDAGSRLAPFGIVWLAPVFGFLFGRRLAQAGSKPPFVSSFFVPMFAVLALLTAGMYVSQQLTGEPLRTGLQYVYYAGPVIALLGLFAWPRAFAVGLLYALLARIPVAIVQYLDVQNGWQTHYGKVHPALPGNLTADERLWMLTLAQGGFWIPFTTLLAGGFAALGAATVRK